MSSDDSLNLDYSQSSSKTNLRPLDDISGMSRYKSHPEELTLTCEAGTAVIVPSLLFHGSHPNKSDSSRELLQFGYRPAWAGPIQPIEGGCCHSVLPLLLGHFSHAPLTLYWCCSLSPVLLSPPSFTHSMLLFSLLLHWHRSHCSLSFSHGPICQWHA